MDDTCIKTAELFVAIIGLVGTFSAGIVGYKTFKRTEMWKRHEFLAQEMKEFFNNSRVQKALTLIDWGSRTMTLLDETSRNNGKVLVTRSMQTDALLPHSLRMGGCSEGEDPASDECADVETSSEGSFFGHRQYTPAEAAIRDCYDAFLDGLERFARYVEAELTDVADLRPYLDYWITDIHAPTNNGTEAAWTAVLLCYIDFYNFSGVQFLFKEFGKSIDLSSDAFEGFLAMMKDEKLEKGLRELAAESARKKASVRHADDEEIVAVESTVSRSRRVAPLRTDVG